MHCRGWPSFVMPCASFWGTNTWSWLYFGARHILRHVQQSIRSCIGNWGDEWKNSSW